MPKILSKIFPSLCGSKFKKVLYEGFCISSREPNNCIISTEKAILLISKIYENAEGIYFEGKRIVESESLFENPCDSGTFNIKVCKLSSAVEFVNFSANRVFKKCLKLPYMNDNYFVCLPLIHT